MKTHADKIKNLLDTCVKLTKMPSNHHRLAVESLVTLILANHDTTLQVAAKNGQTRAFLFVYALGTEYEGIPIFDYLFPNVELGAKLSEARLDSVYLQIEKYFLPFQVEHKIYQIVNPIRVENPDPSIPRETKIKLTEVELSENQINLFRDGHLAGDKYVGAIIVSWNKFCQ